MKTTLKLSAVLFASFSLAASALAGPGQISSLPRLEAVNFGQSGQVKVQRTAPAAHTVAVTPARINDKTPATYFRHATQIGNATL